MDRKSCFNPLYRGVLIVTSDPDHYESGLKVSILFTEVFSL